MQYILNKFKSFENKDAIIVNDEVYTYENFLNQIEIYINILENNQIFSKVIALLGDYSFYNLALFFALAENKNIKTLLKS